MASLSRTMYRLKSYLVPTQREVLTEFSGNFRRGDKEKSTQQVLHLGIHHRCLERKNS